VGQLGLMVDRGSLIVGNAISFFIASRWLIVAVGDGFSTGRVLPGQKPTVRFPKCPRRFATVE